MRRCAKYPRSIKYTLNLRHTVWRHKINQASTLNIVLFAANGGSFAFCNNISPLWIYNQRLQHTSTASEAETLPVRSKKNYECKIYANTVSSPGRLSKLSQTESFINFTLEMNVFPKKTQWKIQLYGFSMPMAAGACGKNTSNAVQRWNIFNKRKYPSSEKHFVCSYPLFHIAYSTAMTTYFHVFTLVNSGSAE